MHCCVISVAGFIGKHLVEMLAGLRKTLTVVDKNRQPTRAIPSRVRDMDSDYSDKNFLCRALNDVNASVPKTSFENPVDDISNNLPPSVNVFEVASSLLIKNNTHG